VVEQVVLTLLAAQPILLFLAVLVVVVMVFVGMPKPPETVLQIPEAVVVHLDRGKELLVLLVAMVALALSSLKYLTT
jgi:hypothetical protein